MKTEILKRSEIIDKVYREKIAQKRRKKLKKYENFSKPDLFLLSSDPFEKNIDELRVKFSSQVKSINYQI